MITKVIAVFDKKTALFATPFNVRHVGEAIREWDILVKDKNNRYGKNPEDFDLYQTAEYDDTTGQFTNITPALHLASGIQ